MSLISIARDLWLVIRNEQTKNANTAIRVGDAAAAILDAIEALPTPVDGVTPHIGENGNWFIGDTDTTIKAAGTNGDDGVTPHIGENGNWFIGATDTTVKAVGTNGDDGISPHIGGNGNWYIGDTDTTIKAAGTNGNDGVSPHIGGNGNWFIGATDTTIKAAGTNGNDGTSVPVNLSIFKPDANALALPVGFKWINNITVTSVQLMTNCSGISVTIGATTYNQTTLIGVTLPAGTQMVINDLTIVAGQNNANAIIIF